MNHYIVSYLSNVNNLLVSRTTVYECTTELAIYRDAIAQKRAITLIRGISPKEYDELREILT